MKKYFFVLLVFAVIISACGNKKNNKAPETSSSDPNVITVRENMFITQINDINLNYKTYLGKTVKIEGMFKEFTWDGKTMYYVYRMTPGCCGDDGIIGFEMSWEEDYQGFSANPDADIFPDANEWIEVQGEIKSYEKFDYPFLYLAIAELNVLDERGAEFVSR